MGSYVSRTQCKGYYNVTLNCFQNMNSTHVGDVAKGEFDADPDIAGVGVVGVFVAVTSFALFVSCFYVGIGVRMWYHKYLLHEQEIEPKELRFNILDLIEKLVLSASDQQIFTGAAYAMTLRYYKGCEISAYHYNIVANMLLLTCGTHLMAITIVSKYWEKPLLALTRTILVTFVFLATGLLLSNQNASSRLFPTEIPNADAESTLMVLPAACFQDEESEDAFKRTVNATLDNFTEVFLDSKPGNKVPGWNLWVLELFGFAFAIVAVIVRAVLACLKNREKAVEQRRGKGPKPFKKRKTRFMNRSFIKWVGFANMIYQIIGITISFTMVVNSANYIFKLRDWMDKSKWLRLHNGTNPENDATSFGQFVPIFLTSLTVFAIIDTVYEEYHNYRERRRGIYNHTSNEDTGDDDDDDEAMHPDVHLPGKGPTTSISLLTTPRSPSPTSNTYPEPTHPNPPTTPLAPLLPGPQAHDEQHDDVGLPPQSAPSSRAPSPERPAHLASPPRTAAGARHERPSLTALAASRSAPELDRALGGLDGSVEVPEGGGSAEKLAATGLARRPRVAVHGGTSGGGGGCGGTGFAGGQDDGGFRARGDLSAPKQGEQVRRITA